MSFKKLHERALELVQSSKKVESELIDILQQIDETKGFRQLGFSSLYQYAVSALKLAESHAYALITVSRKAKEIPELKEAISSGAINTNQARRITSVITPDNKTEWIEKAATLKQKELERAIVSIAPKEAVRETMRFVHADRVKLVCGITDKLMKQIERVKDLHSQKTRQPASLEETLEEIVAFYLDKKDPVKKAERALSKPESLSLSRVPTGKRQSIPARTKHEVMNRDGGQCVHRDRNNQRCEQRRWLDVHHRRPVSEGGANSLENLVTLCKNHHVIQHELHL